VSRASFWSTMRYVAWRNLHTLIRSPVLFLPSVLFPVFFLLAFTGALSSMTKVEGFGTDDYTAFQYVFALLQSAGFTGAMGGFAIAEDFDKHFMGRLMLAAPNRGGILAGYTIAVVVRFAIATVVLTAVAFALGMEIAGSAVEVAGLFSLALLLLLASALWSTGVAMRVGSMTGAPAMVIPVFLLLFLVPVFVPLRLMTGWLHSLATVNPLTRLIETGRGFIAGHPSDILLAYVVGAGLLLLACIWAFFSLRHAEAAGA
jgi:ABC-2 type transport system permease protein